MAWLIIHFIIRAASQWGPKKIVWQINYFLTQLYADTHTGGDEAQQRIKPGGICSRQLSFAQFGRQEEFAEQKTAKITPEVRPFLLQKFKRRDYLLHRKTESFLG